MKRTSWGYVGAVAMGLCGIVAMFGPSAETRAIPAVLREMGADGHLWLDVATVNHARQPELTVVRYDLEYDRLPVIGGQIVVWFHPGGRIEFPDADSRRVVSGPADMDADISEDDAIAAARAARPGGGSFSSEGLAVWARGDTVPVLVRHVHQQDPSGFGSDVYVNADTGKVEGTLGDGTVE